MGFGSHYGNDNHYWHREDSSEREEREKREREIREGIRGDCCCIKCKHIIISHRDGDSWHCRNCEQHAKEEAKHKKEIERQEAIYLKRFPCRYPGCSCEVERWCCDQRREFYKTKKNGQPSQLALGSRAAHHWCDEHTFKNWSYYERQHHKVYVVEFLRRPTNLIFYKIGYTTDLHQRIPDIEKEWDVLAVKLRRISLCDCEWVSNDLPGKQSYCKCRTEKALHAKYRSLRVKGEFFLPNKAILEDPTLLTVDEYESLWDEREKVWRESEGKELARLPE